MLKYPIKLLGKKKCGEIFDKVVATGIVPEAIAKEAEERINKILAENTGKTPEQVKADSERDNWMIAEEAREYGLVDKVIYKR